MTSTPPGAWLSALVVVQLTLLPAAPCAVVRMPGLGMGLQEEGLHQRGLTHPFLSSLSFLTLEIQVESHHFHEDHHSLEDTNP